MQRHGLRCISPCFMCKHGWQKTDGHSGLAQTGSHGHPRILKSDRRREIKERDDVLELFSLWQYNDIEQVWTQQAHIPTLTHYCTGPPTQPQTRVKDSWIGDVVELLGCDCMMSYSRYELWLHVPSPHPCIPSLTTSSSHLQHLLLLHNYHLSLLLNSDTEREIVILWGTEG